jgi:DnaJ-domain-containing protein 1
MELDHDTGEMHGAVLKGEHAGRTLAQMDHDELLALYREAAGNDAESGRLLETYLDRALGDDWRNSAGSNGAGPAHSGSMTPDEALKVLGLHDIASEDDIRAAHRRLMIQNHPDRGGSDYLAAKINEARDVLLGT